MVKDMADLEKALRMDDAAPAPATGGEQNALIPADLLVHPAQQAAVEAPEAALQQEDVDLEPGRLETPQLSHQTSPQEAVEVPEIVEVPEAVMPDQDAIEGMGLSPPPLQLPTTANQASDRGIQYLNKRIRSSSLLVVVFVAGIVVTMFGDHSNKKHPPTVFSAFLTLLASLSLYGLVSEFLNPRPGPLRYRFIKILVHVCAFSLVSLAFSLSLMMRMNVVVTSLTVAAAAVLVAHRLWQCAATELRRDVDAYMGCEEELQQLLELSSNVQAMLFQGWFGLAFFHFQNYPAEARHARSLLASVSEYLTFFTSVAASLTPLKAVPRSLAPCPRLARQLNVLIWLLVLGVVTTVLLIAASKVGGYAALALVPEAVALAAWALPAMWLPPWLGYGHGGERGESPSLNFVSVALTLLPAVQPYLAKDGGMSSLYDEAFVLVIAAEVVAALGWWMVTQRMTPAGMGVQPAAKILAFFTFWLLALSVLAFLGVIRYQE